MVRCALPGAPGTCIRASDPARAKAGSFLWRLDVVPSVRRPAGRTAGHLLAPHGDGQLRPGHGHRHRSNPCIQSRERTHLAKALLENSENVINKTANRPIWDAVKFAENDVRRAKERLKTIRGELTHFRNTEQIIEPNSSVVSTNTAFAGSLKTTLLQLQTELATLSNRQLGPNAPAIVALQSRISATKDQLAMVESQVNTDKQGKPLSTVVGKFEQLDMERQFAQNMVLSTMQLLEQARASALTQHIYVNPFVHPSLPESSVFPRRILSIFVVGVICFMLWTIGLLVVRAIREHIA